MLIIANNPFNDPENTGEILNDFENCKPDEIQATKNPCQLEWVSNR